MSKQRLKVRGSLSSKKMARSKSSSTPKSEVASATSSAAAIGLRPAFSTAERRIELPSCRLPFHQCLSRKKLADNCSDRNGKLKSFCKNDRSVSQVQKAAQVCGALASNFALSALIASILCPSPIIATSSSYSSSCDYHHKVLFL